MQSRVVRGNVGGGLGSARAKSGSRRNWMTRQRQGHAGLSAGSLGEELVFT